MANNRKTAAAASSSGRALMKQTTKLKFKNVPALPGKKNRRVAAAVVSKYLKKPAKVQQQKVKKAVKVERVVDEPLYCLCKTPYDNTK